MTVVVVMYAAMLQESSGQFRQTHLLRSSCPPDLHQIFARLNIRVRRHPSAILPFKEQFCMP
jgi:hypothetical protein